MARPPSAPGRLPRLTPFASLLLFVSITTLSVVLAGFLHLPRTLRQSQACRMSRMWPSYVPHHDAMKSPSGLSSKYSLFLYRERPPGPRDPSLDLPSGRPALFVPGNAGSYGQVRSVASSAHNAYFIREADPSGGVREEWRGTPEMDWWTVDFNEDFSAFHGSTMQEQAIFINEVLTYLRSVYSSVSDLRIPILAHSMGGIVSRLMLKLDNHPNGTVDTLVTLSSPHAYPPVPFDGVVEDVYRAIREPAGGDVLIVSLSGGVLDTQLPSEPASLSLSRLLKPETQLSGFTTALPALWSSVDHLAMMWCDQVRERVARGFMRDAAVVKSEDRGGERGLQRRREIWRKAIGLEPQEDGQALFDEANAVAVLPLLGVQGVLTSPLRSGTRLVDVKNTTSGSFEIVTNLAVGPDPTMLPPIDQPMPLRILFCVPQDDDETATCHPALPWHFELLPIDSQPRAEERYENPSIGMRRLSVEARRLREMGVRWIKIVADVREDSEPKDDATIKGWSGRGWVKYGWAPLPRVVRSSSSLLPMTVALVPKHDRMDPNPVPTPFLSRFFLPDRDSTIVAWRYELRSSFCGKHQLARRFKPILKVEHPVTGDGHWRADLPTKEDQRFVFALHGSSSFMPLPERDGRGALVSLWADTGPSEDGCAPFDELRITVAWRASAGLLLSRYRTSLAALPLAYVVLAGIALLSSVDAGEATSPSLHQEFMRPKLVGIFLAGVPISQLIASAVLSLAPTQSRPEEAALGLHGFELWQVFGVGFTLAVVAVGLALGVALVMEVWIAVCAALVGRLRLARRIGLPPAPGRPYGVTRALTTALLLVPIYIWIPYQAAFILSFLFHLSTTLRSRVGGADSARFQQNLWLANVLLWLLPIHALVVLVWFRNLGVGWRAPLGGSDHNPLRIAAVLVLVQTMAGGGVLRQRGTRLERLLTRSVLVWLVALALFRGLRHTYVLSTSSNVLFAFLALLHWRGAHLSPRGKRPETLPMGNVVPKVRSSDGPSGEEDEGEGETAYSSVPTGVEAPDLDEAMRLAKGGGEAKVDELLARYLDVVDRYQASRCLCAESFAKGFLQLSRARMHLGARGFTSLGNDGWDARSRARVRVSVGEEGMRLREVGDEEMRREREEEECVVAEGREVGETGLRQRKGVSGKEPSSGTDEKASLSAAADEKDATKAKQEHKTLLPPSPLYQFGALPPTSLRTAQTHFVAALRALIDSGLAVEGELVDLEGRIRAARERERARGG